MVIRFFWKNCRFCDGDALWVEATKAEAAWFVFPRLSEEDISQSKQFAKESGHLAEMMGGRPNLTFCFLVAKDLSFIRPFQVHYPVHQLWNAYSPFQKISEMTVANLDAVRGIELPLENRASS